MSNSADRRKIANDMHTAGKSYAEIAEDLGISRSRAKQLSDRYDRDIRDAIRDNEFGNVSFSRTTINCLRRNDIRNIEELKQKITKGIERRISLRWYLDGEYIRNAGDKTWVNEILPFLDSIGFDWHKYYKGSDVILKRLGRNQYEKNKAEWTTEKPNKSGVYWAFNGNEVFLVDVSFGRGLCEIHGLGDFYSEMMVYGLDYFTHYLGPLQPPEPPKASA